MKKLLAIIALALFIGGIAAPVVAASLNVNVAVELRDDDPKKKTTKKATAEKSTSTEKASTEGCSETKEASKKEASKCGEATKKSDCSKSCGGGS